MFNLFKRILVKYLVRQYKVVFNIATSESFIVSYVSQDGYVVLLTQYDTYLPLKYKVFKKNFSKALSIDNDAVSSISDNNIILSSGRSVKLTDINEQLDSEEGADFF
jgi:hypothetical protein